MNVKHLSASLLGVALLAGCTSNNSKPDSQVGTDSKPAAAKETKGADATASNVAALPTTQPAAAKPVEYSEVSAKGRIYVLGSKSSADKAAAGELPEVTVTKIGSGPNGETVVFEADKNKIESQLQAEYAKRHPQK